MYLFLINTYLKFKTDLYLQYQILPGKSQISSQIIGYTLSFWKKGSTRKSRQGCSIYLRYSLKPSRLVSAATSTIMTKLSLIPNALRLQNVSTLLFLAHLYLASIERNEIKIHPLDLTQIIYQSIFVDFIRKTKHQFYLKF